MVKALSALTLIHLLLSGQVRAVPDPVWSPSTAEAQGSPRRGLTSIVNSADFHTEGQTPGYEVVTADYDNDDEDADGEDSWQNKSSTEATANDDDDDNSDNDDDDDNDADDQDDDEAEECDLQQTETDLYVHSCHDSSMFLELS